MLIMTITGIVAFFKLTGIFDLITHKNVISWALSKLNPNPKLSQFGALVELQLASHT